MPEVRCSHLRGLSLITVVTKHGFEMMLLYRVFISGYSYDKIVKSDWFLTALISALIGQFNRTVRVMPK